MPHLVKLLLDASKPVFPGRSVRALHNRLQLVRAGLRHPALTRGLIDPKPGTTLALLMSERPEMVGVLVWPYQCASWPADVRIERVANHCAVVDTLGLPFPFSVHDRLVLAEMDDAFSGLRLVLDQPRWFMREGLLVLNIFIGNFRAYSLAFSLHMEADRSLSMVIGGVQGRNTDDALDLYRDLTKSLHGMRPRDFLLEVAKMFGRELGMVRILGVMDAQRHHRHPYFAKKNLPGDYDEIWEDRGGFRLDSDFYELSIQKERRDFKTIKPKKRSLYKQRFDMLDLLEGQLCERLRSGSLVQFKDT